MQGLQTSMSDAIKITDDFARLGKKAFDGFADSLTDAIMTGKANFKDFARSVY
jgi:lambda family phage tail tape measure protein